MGIINDILDFSKIEGQIELELIPFSLPGLIEDVTAFAYRAEKRS